MDAREEFLNDVFDYRRAVILLSAANGGVFELLIDGNARSAAEIARELNWTERGAEILLNALCGLEYLAKSDGKYSISLKYRKVFNADDYHLIKEWLLHEWRLMRRWIHLPEVLESGQPYREREKKKIHRNHRNFILSMAHREKENLEILLQLLNLDDRRNLLDLGGGPGIFSIGLAEKYEQLQATVFDTPETEPVARKFFKESQANEKLHFKGGNFLTDDLGNGYDAVLISSVLHIYSPHENIDLLKKVFKSLDPGGKIFIRDFFLNEDKTEPAIGSMFAVNMLVNTERGNAYSTEEMKVWLLEAGFSPGKTENIQGKMALLVAQKD